ncbi:hypothetical protein HY090_01100 [Candidatus Kaiserbacteria bacterium]|nr:hypothetical protein [Candidatus Kaiserbacteria bacterium]
MDEKTGGSIKRDSVPQTRHEFSIDQESGRTLVIPAEAISSGGASAPEETSAVEVRPQTRDESLATFYARNHPEKSEAGKGSWFGRFTNKFLDSSNLVIKTPRGADPVTQAVVGSGFATAGGVFLDGTIVGITHLGGISAILANAAYAGGTFLVLLHGGILVAAVAGSVLLTAIGIANVAQGVGRMGRWAWRKLTESKQDTNPAQMKSIAPAGSAVAH